MQDEASPRSEKRRQPKKITPKRLRNAALFYIDRYAPAEAQLRRVLRARITRSARTHDEDPTQYAELIEEMIRDFRQAGLLDDGRYAQSKAASLLRRGTSPKGIAAYLRARGIAQPGIDAALAALQETCADPDLAAAAAYARKRRIGPYRPEDERQTQHDRDLAALGRRGFSYETARAVLAADDPQALEALCRQASF